MPAEPRRILMTADAVGGVWTYALDLARALEPVGVQITMATMGPPPRAAQLEAAAALGNVDLAISRFRLEWMDEPWADVASAGAWLLDLDARIRPDVVHLNGYAHAALPFQAPVVAVGHSCVLSWDAAIPDSIDPRALAAYQAQVQRGIQGADLVVAPTRAMLQALTTHYGPLERAVVVPNGRRPDLFAPGDKEPFVFTAGRLWDRAKNIDAVAAVAALLPWPVALAGPEAPDSGADAGAGNAAHGLPHVRSLGLLDERSLADWLGRAAIFVLPARYEPFGLLPLEAALSGCALVLGDIPSLREVWGDSAEYVHPDDRDGLARALTAMMSSPRLLASRAAAARQRAARYSLDAMRAGYLDAYHVARMRYASTEAAACAS